MTVAIQTVRGRQKSFGFGRVAAATFWTKPMDVSKNLEKHWEMAQRANKEHVQLMVFPELGLSGYTCDDLFHQHALLDACEAALLDLLEASKALDLVAVVGLPWRVVISERNEGKIELKRRGEKEARLVEERELFDLLSAKNSV